MRTGVFARDVLLGALLVEYALEVEAGQPVRLEAFTHKHSQVIKALAQRLHTVAGDYFYLTLAPDRCI